MKDKGFLSFSLTEFDGQIMKLEGLISL
ncbi:uncharacterized protein METZ01_LOCUS85526 [marine metagenome]|uniref:Uncharacterized protein n=1 Tax=marine metagenome TaxID=408172 RepID=A0A381UX10_9ZZZZ